MRWAMVSRPTKMASRIVTYSQSSVPALSPHGLSSAPRAPAKDDASISSPPPLAAPCRERRGAFLSTT
eukprot:scaffold58218_cov34-Tisochrysis_lutea.AAC.1